MEALQQDYMERQLGAGNTAGTPERLGLPFHLKPVPVCASKEEEKDPRVQEPVNKVPNVTADDIHDCGVLASMVGGDEECGEPEEEEEEEECSVLAAMAAADDEDVPVNTKVGSEPAAGVTVHLAADGSAQTLQERHNQLKVEAQEAFTSGSEWFTVIPKRESLSSSLQFEPSLQNVSSYGSLTSDNLATCNFSPVPGHMDRGTSPLIFPQGSDPLMEVPVSAIKGLPQVEGIEDSTGGDRSPSLIAKRVSFENVGIETDSPRSTRPLPPLALPPIGATYDPRPHSKEEWHMQRGLKNRPLPPIAFDEVLGSRESLGELSGSSQLLSTSSNSLPLPDPRFRRATLPRLVPEIKKKGRGRRKRSAQEQNSEMPRTRQSPLSHLPKGYSPRGSPEFY